VNPYLAIDHIQLAMPPNGEDRAREFYVAILGMTEIEKPEELRRNGGCWFASGDVQIHLGVEHDFAPARKAHPALACADYDGLLAHLRSLGIVVTEQDLPDRKRAFIADLFGNRIELVG